jgi:tRNA threonylcarbamoyl adenosine modification protein YeaZ
LGIDTSGATASAAIVGPGVVGAAATDAPRAHAAELPALIAAAAERAGVALSVLTGVAAARGPGLFTGMRVGLVAAATFGWAWGLPDVGVSTLAAAAARTAAPDGAGPPRTVLLDARRREVFGQRFDGAGRPVGEPVVVRPEDLPADLRTPPVFADPRLPLPFPSEPLDVAGLALEVAGLARLRAGLGQPQEPAGPLYLRRPDVTVSGGPRPVLGPR